MADRIMANVKRAPASDLKGLIAELGSLMSTEGLSAPCRQLLSSMVSVAATTISADIAAGMPPEMKGPFMARHDSEELGLESKRAACLSKAAVETQAHTLASNSQKVEKGDSTKSADEQLAEDESIPIHERLVRLRAKLDEYFKARNGVSLESLSSIFDKIAKNDAYDASCRVAAASSVKQIQNSLKSIKASDEDGRKFAEKLANFTSSSVKIMLKDCQ